MTRRKKQIKKSALMIIILTILISIGLYFLLFSKSTGGLLVRSKDKTAKFDYTLDKENTNLMKENFKELKDILANDNINYEDYAKTLNIWHENFENNLDEVKKLGFDDYFIRMWKMYLNYCEAGFLTRNINLHQLVFTRDQNIDLNKGLIA